MHPVRFNMCCNLHCVSCDTCHTACVMSFVIHAMQAVSYQSDDDDDDGGGGGDDDDDDAGGGDDDDDALYNLSCVSFIHAVQTRSHQTVFHL